MVRTLDLILTMFHNCDNDKNNVTVIMKNTQKQIGSIDCGLFTVAVMTSLPHKEDPSTATYNQQKMRQHLQEYFFQCSMPFPKLNYRIRRNFCGMYISGLSH